MNRKDRALAYLIENHKTFMYCQTLDTLILFLLWYYGAHWVFYIMLILNIISLFGSANKLSKLEKQAGVKV